MSINIGKSKFIIFIICLINILSLPLLALDKIDPKIAIAENITGQDSTLINLYYQGFKEYRVSDPVRSNNYLLKLAKLHDARGELTKKYYWYAEIGQIYHKLGMHHLALEYLIETSSYFLEQDDEIRLAWLYSDIGNVYYAIDQYELAEPYYHDGFKLMSKNQNNYGKAVLLNNIALCQIKKGNVEEAFDSFEKALKIREEFCSTYVVEHSKLLMAENYALIGNDEQAFKLYSEIWTQSLSDKKYESETMILKSSAGLALFDYCKQAGDFSKAEQYLEDSIHLIEEVGDYHTLGLALARKADYYQEINRNKESLKILHEIFDYALEHKFYNNAHSYADRLVILNLKLNNAKESAKYYDYYSTLTDTLLAYRATKNLVQLHTLIQNHTTEAENKLLKKEHAYSIAQNRLNEMENERLKEQNRYSIRFLILTTIFLIIIIILVILFYLRDKKNLEKIIKIANASSEGIVVHDRGNIIDSNNQFKKMFQDSGVDLTNKNLLDFSLQENKKEIQEIFFATEKTELKTKLISANDKIIDVKISSRPYNYRSKKVSVAVIQDITKINEYIRSIMAAQKELRVLNSTKDKLLAIIGHDLKNPFNAITGFSDLMKDSWRSMDPKEVDEMLHMINQSSLAAHSLLENLLDWARIQTEQLKLNQTSFYLLSSIKEAFSVLRSSTKIKQIDIQIDCNENIIMYADYSMVTTIIRNLLSNAIKFSHREGLIKVSAAEISDFITISVKDNGVGMSEEEIESIFRIEKISSKNGTDNEKGTGLGLTLCKEIIQAHKGNISIESELGKGSKFTVMFPKKNTNY